MKAVRERRRRVGRVIRVGGGVVEGFCDALRRGCGCSGEEELGCLVMQLLRKRTRLEKKQIAPPLSERGCDA
jgi:hypothetical protein